MITAKPSFNDYTKKDCTGNALCSLWSQAIEQIDLPVQQAQKLNNRVHRVIQSYYPDERRVRDKKKLRQLRADIKTCVLQIVGSQKNVTSILSILLCAHDQLLQMIDGKIGTFPAKNGADNSFAIPGLTGEIPEDAIPITFDRVNIAEDTLDTNGSNEGGENETEVRLRSQSGNTVPRIQTILDYWQSIGLGIDIQAFPAERSDIGSRTYCTDTRSLFRSVNVNRHMLISLTGDNDLQRTFVVSNKRDLGTFLLNNPPGTYANFAGEHGISRKQMEENHAATSIRCMSMSQWNRCIGLLLERSDKIQPLKKNNPKKIPKSEKQRLRRDLCELVNLANAFRLVTNRHTSRKKSNGEMTASDIAKELDRLNNDGIHISSAADSLPETSRVSLENLTFEDVRRVPSGFFLSSCMGTVTPKTWAGDIATWLELEGHAAAVQRVKSITAKIKTA